MFCIYWVLSCTLITPLGYKELVPLRYFGIYHVLCPLLFLNSSSSVSVLFVCVEVLRPSQPNGVMSSAVSLPNHTFTGQA